ncbi:inactive ribonuclease-like protein 9 [Meriones unguiculatus]|uniref:inactive ribonuclease-like protein 9 n=1 Tax=Meriones unguiculatus TaxID=10047 RepID=UPI000B4EA56C|nr:inactive ribonuclease-like protein 9 [Meriones unguiculatus]
MKSLVTKRPWPVLLLLLLLPLKPQGNYWDYEEYELNPELRDYLRERHQPTPTKPPTLQRIIEKIIADPDRPFYGEDYCRTELLYKNLHYKLRCYPEFYILNVPFFRLQRSCTGVRVECNNGAQFCRRSVGVMPAVRCVLEGGDTAGNCEYQTTFVTGYPVVTCQWDNDTKLFVPNNVLDVMPAE